MTQNFSNPNSCSNCKKKGHTRDQCWVLYPNLGPKGWKVVEKRGGDASPFHSNTTNNSIPMPRHLLQQTLEMFSNQMQKINFLQQMLWNCFQMWYQTQIKSSCGIASNSKDFFFDQIIIDSGATNHMFGNKQLLSNLKPTNGNQYVSVANGMKAKVNGIGEINLYDKQIKNVLYLETFPVNLISVNKLTQELNCNAIFFCKNVVFQDRKIGINIGE